MNRISLLLLLATLASFGQIKFENGYIITTDGEKKECLIKNVDWRNNPETFSYKLPGSEEILEGNITSIAEFGIPGAQTFVRAQVKIDRSPVDLKYLREGKNPEWSEETVFLRSLFQGNANLYSFRQGNLVKFFYSTPTVPVNQLVYKKYMGTVNNNREVLNNNSFRQQLWNDVRCPDATVGDIEKVVHEQNDLIDYFKHYHSCTGGPANEVTEKKARKLLTFKIAPGVSFATFSLDNPYTLEDVDFGSQANLRLGAELEYILPFNNNKWAATFEPIFESYKAEKEIVRFNNIVKTNIDYKTIDFAIGLRYYMYFSTDFSGFVNAAYMPGFSRNMDSSVNYGQYHFEARQKPNFSFGAGLGYKRFTFEARTFTTNDLLNDQPTVYGGYNKFSLIVGYKIFEVKTKK